MANQISCGPIHHLRLTVTDLNRSRDFYTQVLGFGVAMDTPPPDHPEHARITEAMQGGVVLTNYMPASFFLAANDSDYKAHVLFVRASYQW